MKTSAIKKSQMVWKCPKCGRIFRGHVFCPSTVASGPVCNACGVPLEWVEIEVKEQEGKDES